MILPFRSRPVDLLHYGLGLSREEPGAVLSGAARCVGPAAAGAGRGLKGLQDPGTEPAAGQGLAHPPELALRAPAVHPAQELREQALGQARGLAEPVHAAMLRHDGRLERGQVSQVDRPQPLSTQGILVIPCTEAFLSKKSWSHCGGQPHGNQVR